MSKTDCQCLPPSSPNQKYYSQLVVVAAINISANSYSIVSPSLEETLGGPQRDPILRLYMEHGS